METEAGIDDLIAMANGYDKRVVIKALLRFVEAEPDTTVSDSLGYETEEDLDSDVLEFADDVSAEVADSLYVGIVLDGYQSSFIYLFKKD